jgi:hypothetical protein
MKKSIYVIGLSMAIPASQALALDEASFKAQSTKDLVALCSTNASDTYHEFSRGFCLGYIDGAWDYHLALTKGPKFDPLACPQPTVTRDQAMEVFLSWARANPGEYADESPVQAVMRSFSEEWPCPGN